MLQLPLPSAASSPPPALPPLLLLQVLPELLRSATLAAEKGLGPDEAYVRNMLGFVWGPLVDVLPKVGCRGGVGDGVGGGHAQGGLEFWWEGLGLVENTGRAACSCPLQRRCCVLCQCLNG